MSSISASDRNRQTDEVRSTREEYQDKEAELIKKQKKELQRLEQKHQETVDNIKKNFSEEIADLRNKNKDSLTKRDVDNQDKIDKVRGMYLEQIKRKSEEMANRQEAADSSFEDQLAKEKAIHAQQVDTLKRNFDNSLQERDRQIKDFTSKARDEVKDTIGERTDKLSRKYENEMKVMTEDRDRSIGAMQKTLDDVKSLADNDLKTERRSRQGEIDRMNHSFMNTYKNQEYQNNVLLDNKGEVLKEARSGMQKRYQDALEQKLASLDKARESLEDQVDERLDRDVRSAKSELAKVKNDKIVETITSRRLRDLEMTHLQRAYEARMEDLNRERREMLGKANDLTHERIDKVVNRTEGLIQETNRNDKLKMDMLNLKHKEDRGQLEVTHKNQMDYLQGRTEDRVKKIMHETNKALQTSDVIKEKTIDELKNNYYDTLASQREIQTDALNDTRLRMEQRLHENESKAQNKHEETVNFFESRLEKLEENKHAEAKKIEDTFSQKLTSQEKAHKMEMAAQEQKFEIKSSQQEEIHQKELDRLEKRHQEQMQNLSKQIAYAKRKV